MSEVQTLPPQPIHAVIAQSGLERQPSKLYVVGSNPTGGAILLRQGSLVVKAIDSYSIDREFESLSWYYIFTIYKL